METNFFLTLSKYDIFNTRFEYHIKVCAICRGLLKHSPYFKFADGDHIVAMSFIRIRVWIICIVSIKNNYEMNILFFFWKRQRKFTGIYYNRALTGKEGVKNFCFFYKLMMRLFWQNSGEIYGAF